VPDLSSDKSKAVDEISRLKIQSELYLKISDIAETKKKIREALNEQELAPKRVDAEAMGNDPFSPRVLGYDAVVDDSAVDIPKQPVPAFEQSGDAAPSIQFPIPVPLTDENPVSGEAMSKYPQWANQHQVQQSSFPGQAQGFEYRFNQRLVDNKQGIQPGFTEEVVEGETIEDLIKVSATYRFDNKVKANVYYRGLSMKIYPGKIIKHDKIKIIDIDTEGVKVLWKGEEYFLPVNGGPSLFVNVDSKSEKNK
jgi:hypothetical protein